MASITDEMINVKNDQIITIKADPKPGNFFPIFDQLNINFLA